MANNTISAGFLGAGYISKWHAEALSRVNGVSLEAVCDLSGAAARDLANAYGASKVYQSLDDMLGDDALQAIHVLTPPNAHFDVTRQILEAGKHAFVEKPLVLSSDEARILEKVADDNQVVLGVNHNFLLLPGYDRFKEDVRAGRLGTIDSFSAHWRFPLAPLRSGPFGLWMLREPTNILFEIGPHLFAFAADLFDTFDVRDVLLRYPVEIPGGVTHYQGWRISGVAGETAVTLDLSLIEGHDDRSITARGLGGLARFNFAEDSYAFQRAPMQEIVVGPFASQAGLGVQHLKTASTNAVRQVASLNMLAPYGLSITRACQSFYRSLTDKTPLDRRLTPALAGSAIKFIEAAIEKAKPAITPKKIYPVADSPDQPDMLVIGGTGFIGRKLTHALADEGYNVRVFSRGKGVGFERPDGRISVFSGSLFSDEDLQNAMKGVKGVFHLARADEKSWEGYLQNDVAVTRRIGEACLEAGIQRLVYTGTIDSYDASQPDRPITEETPFDHNLEERNLYARSKAACEAALKELSAQKGLPLVIARPGIVIGEHGPLQHWGIAMWRGATACKLWGDGRNILPFVSVSDTADGLVKTMTTENIEGKSFNLIGDPLLTGVEYFEEIEKAYGVKMRAKPTPIWTFFAIDMAKYWAKRLLARRKGLKKPTMRDWKSRAQLSPYDNRVAKTSLAWSPETDRQKFVKSTIVEANLFGVAPQLAESAIIELTPTTENGDDAVRAEAV